MVRVLASRFGGIEVPMAVTFVLAAPALSTQY